MQIILIGLVIGVFARMFMPARDPGGVVATTAFGVVGALAGDFLAPRAGLYTQYESSGLLAAVLGALVVLTVYRLYAVERTTPAFH